MESEYLRPWKSVFHHLIDFYFILFQKVGPEKERELGSDESLFPGVSEWVSEWITQYFLVYLYIEWVAQLQLLVIASMK